MTAPSARSAVAGAAAAEIPAADIPAAGAAAGPAPGREDHAAGLSARLMALARLIQVGAVRSGEEGFSRKLLADAEQVLSRAGSRLRLSGDHTVVVLAGGSGSGKSALFNKLAGADFSVVGVTRPVTTEPHSCIWGSDGAGPLLDWLAVPRRNRYSRSSALDRGEDELAGLVLVDLPDHDSVLTDAADLADQVAVQADTLFWVLDPQKYADAAVHQRYLAPLAGHADVLAVVLNQADTLRDHEADECVGDLRRLLESEGLQEVPILVTSAVSGAGLDDVRKLLVNAVTARRAAAARIWADLDSMGRRFARYAGSPDGDGDAPGIPAASQTRLTGAFADAAGVSLAGELVRAAIQAQAGRFCGWPPWWLARRIPRRGQPGVSPGDQLRALAALPGGDAGRAAGHAGARQAEIDNALSVLADEVAGPLPDPWRQTVRSAIRSRAGQIPAALDDAVRECLPARESASRWWRLAGAWQGVLAGGAVLGLAWTGAVVAFGVLHAGSHTPALVGHARALPWAVGATIAVLGAGWLTAAAARRRARTGADRAAAAVESVISDRVAGITREKVIFPAGQEIAELQRFRAELAAVAGR